MNNSTSVSPARVARPIVAGCSQFKTPEDFAAHIASSIDVSVEAGAVGPAGIPGESGEPGQDAAAAQFTCNSFPIGSGQDNIVVAGDLSRCFTSVRYVGADLLLADTGFFPTIITSTGTTSRINFSAVASDDSYVLDVFCPVC